MTHAHLMLLTPSAQMPRRGSPLSAGLDIRADLLDQAGRPRSPIPGKRVSVQTGGDFGVRWVLHPGGRVVIPTGIAMTTSPDIYIRIAPRSGLAVKHGIDTLAGVVDADYTDEIGAVLINLDPDEPFTITQGDRIAQLVLTHVSLTEPELCDHLEVTDRTGGYGSTGVA